MELSRRLKTVAEAVTPGSRVADVGTDHGYVPIWLVKEKRCERAYAMDVNPGPLERAEAHIRGEGLSDVIETRLGNGLSALSPEETDAVVIAGMGGDLICRILKADIRFLRAGKELILQPQSEWFKVRHLLHDEGYRIEREWFLQEEGKYYVIIRAVPAPEGKPEHYADEFFYEYGFHLLRERNPVLLEYLQKEKEKREQILQRLKNQGNSGDKAESLPEKGRQNRELRCGQLSEEIRKIAKYL